MKPSSHHSGIASVLEENQTLKREIEEIKAKVDEYSLSSQQLRTECCALRTERDRARANVAEARKRMTKLESKLASASTARRQLAAETQAVILALKRSLLLNQPRNKKEQPFELNDTESSGDDTVMESSPCPQVR